jgi:tripartite-type tricarboxylate transporter receptor subunit TctC
MKTKRKGARIQKWTIMALIAVVGIIFGICDGVIAADKFPTRAVTVINPLRPGGGTDIELRNLTPFVQKYLEEAVVVKSMPGGGTTIGVTAAENAKSDGYTLICVPLQHAILAQNFHESGTHLENFEPIYGWFEGPMSIEVKGDSPFKTLDDLIAASKQKKLKAALAGIGSIDHLHTMLLEQQLGIKATTIPYGGGGPASKAAMGGEVDFLVGLSTTAVRFVRDGKLRVLAILGPKRLEALPDSPTIYELGYKDYPNISFIRGVLSPPGTPQEVVSILEAAFKKAVDDPGFREIMKKQGRPVKPFSSKDMKQAAADTFKLSQKYTPFMKEAAKKK